MLRKWFNGFEKVGLSALTIGFALLTSTPAFARIEVRPSKKNVADLMAAKVNRLNFPALPKEVLTHGVSKDVRNDAQMAMQWGLNNIGFFEIFNPLVQPIKPQDTKRCASEIVVAVVDTGIDYTHPELKDHLWVNRGEVGPWSSPDRPDCKDKSCNGIDDDRDGFADDVVGWDFVNEVPLPFDKHGHGTHIAGIISSSAANGMGATGVCPGVTIMPLKYYDNSAMAFNNLQNTVRAIEFAVKHGAQIINYSGGGAEQAPSERAAVELAQARGILFVAAAGNDGHDNEHAPYYPASYGLDNIISVASIGQDNKLLPSSNFGKTVHVAAPGLSIFSTLNGQAYGTMSGTSQATAFVTGAAALLASQSGMSNGFDYRQLKRWILAGTKPLPAQERADKRVSDGMLYLPAALTAQKTELKTAPKPSDIAVRPNTRTNGTPVR